MNRRAIAKLSAEIQQLHRDRCDDEGLTPAEAAFAELSAQKGKRHFRHGWPDFLVMDIDYGGAVCVEVKHGKDVVSESQRRMFSALERVGLRVFVWNPTRPGALTPWRSYSSKRGSGRPPDPRPPMLGRMRPAKGFVASQTRK